MSEKNRSGNKKARACSAVHTVSCKAAPLCFSGVKALFFCCLLLGAAAAYNPAPAAGEGGRCIKVVTSTVDTMDLEVSVRGIGTLEAVQQVTIRPEVDGLIEAVHFEEGETVEKGQLLFSIDDARIRDRLDAKKAALEEAEANLENARLVYRRRQRLFKKELGTEEARDEARAQYKAIAARVSRLKAEIRETREILADTKIKAPFTGIAGERYVDPGEWVKVGTRLVPLVQTGRLKIAFTVPEKYLGEVETGQKVKVHAPSAQDKVFEGSVYFVSPLIRQDTRNILIKAYIDNPGHELSPGGFAAADLILDVLKDRPVIPEEALIPTRMGYMVFVVDNSEARGRKVDIGIRKPGIVEIEKGLKAGETVIRAGHISVREGDKVCPEG